MDKSLSRISWAYWFKKVLYYQVALVYTLTRLVTNVSQVPCNLLLCDIGMKLSLILGTSKRIYILCSFTLVDLCYVLLFGPNIILPAVAEGISLSTVVNILYSRVNFPF